MPISISSQSPANAATNVAVGSTVSFHVGGLLLAADLQIQLDLGVGPVDAIVDGEFEPDFSGSVTPSGDGFDVVLNPDALFPPDTEVEILAAGSNSHKCLLFGGVDGKVSIADHADLTLGNGDRTLEILFQLSELPTADYGNILFAHTREPGNTTPPKWMFGYGPAKTPFDRNDGVRVFWFHGNDGAGTAPFIFSATAATPSLNVWHHVAVTHTGSTWKLWLDGVLISTYTSSLNMPDVAGNLKLGFAETGFVGAPGYWNGPLCKWRYSNNVRYTDTFTPPTSFTDDANTIALLLVDEGAGTDVADASGNNHGGTIVGGATWTELEFESLNTSWSFTTAEVAISDQSPEDEAEDVASDAAVSFHVEGLISTDDLQVSIGGVDAIVDGEFEAGFSGTLTPDEDEDGYDVVINHAALFASGASVAVLVEAGGVTSNWSFTAIEVVLSEQSPAASAEGVANNASISFRLDGLEDDSDLDVTVGGSAAITGGVFQSGFSGSITTGDGGFDVTINHAVLFTSGVSIAVLVEVAALVFSDSWSFTVGDTLQVLARSTVSSSAFGGW